MYNLLNVYDCPLCGKRLSDECTIGEDIDIERDRIEQYRKCNKCGSAVTQRTHEGLLVYEEVDEERARWANGFYDSMFNNNY